MFGRCGPDGVRGHAVHVIVVAGEVAQRQAVQGQTGDQTAQAVDRLELAAERADQGRLARGQFGLGGGGRRQTGDLGQDQLGHFGHGVVAGLGRGREDALVLAHAEARTGPVGQAAFDADLLIQPCREAAAHQAVADQ